MEQGRVTANGIDFAYLCAGPEDGPLVLCLHGFPDHAPSFTPLLRDLAAAGFRAVAPWMRGYHPTSLAPDGRYQSAVLALDALALVEALSPDGSAALVGHDWGAMAACGAAILAPSRVDRLWSDWSPGFVPDPAPMLQLKQTLGTPGVLAAALGYYRQTLDFARKADELASVQVDVSSGTIEVPAVFLMGDDGCFAPDRSGASLAHCSEEARVEILDGCGHFLHVEAPERVNAVVLEALASR